MGVFCRYPVAVPGSCCAWQSMLASRRPLPLAPLPPPRPRRRSGRSPKSICIFAFGKNYSSHQFLNWWQRYATGISHLDRFDSAIYIQKADTPTGYLLFGAANRNRTGTLFTARDFKSLVSTCSTIAAWEHGYGITFVGVRQVKADPNSAGRALSSFPKTTAVPAARSFPEPPEWFGRRNRIPYCPPFAHQCI